MITKCGWGTTKSSVEQQPLQCKKKNNNDNERVVKFLLQHSLLLPMWLLFHTLFVIVFVLLLNKKINSATIVIAEREREREKRPMSSTAFNRPFRFAIHLFPSLQLSLSLCSIYFTLLFPILETK